MPDSSANLNPLTKREFPLYYYQQLYIKGERGRGRFVIMRKVFGGKDLVKNLEK